MWLIEFRLYVSLSNISAMLRHWNTLLSPVNSVSDKSRSHQLESDPVHVFPDWEGNNFYPSKNGSCQYAMKISYSLYWLTALVEVYACPGIVSWLTDCLYMTLIVLTNNLNILKNLFWNCDTHAQPMLYMNQFLPSAYLTDWQSNGQRTNVGWHLGSAVPPITTQPTSFSWPKWMVVWCIH